MKIPPPGLPYGPDPPGGPGSTAGKSNHQSSHSEQLDRLLGCFCFQSFLDKCTGAEVLMATLRLEQRLSPEEIAAQIHFPVKLVRDFIKRLEAEMRADFS